MTRWQDLIVTDGEDRLATLEEAVRGELPDWAASAFWGGEMDEEGTVVEMHELYLCSPDEFAALVAEAATDETTVADNLYLMPRCPVDWTGCREALLEKTESERRE